MKKVLFILLLISFKVVYPQGGGMRVKDLQTTTTGSTNDYLIKDDSAGTPGSTKKIKVSAFKTLYGVGSVTSVGATGGTGITVTGSPITTSGTLTVTNTAPDQTVTIGNGTGISATGTYPTFTITNTSPDQTVTIGSGTNISVTGTYPTFTVTNTQSLNGYVQFSDTSSNIASKNNADNRIPYTGASKNGNLNQKNFTNANKLGTDSVSGATDLMIYAPDDVDIRTDVGAGNNFSVTSYDAIISTAHDAGVTAVDTLTLKGSNNLKVTTPALLISETETPYSNTASALMELSSTTKGILIPRMTTVQRDAIGTPATSLMIYNTTTTAYNFYNGSSWIEIIAGSTPTFTSVNTNTLTTNVLTATTATTGTLTANVLTTTTSSTSSLTVSSATANTYAGFNASKQLISGGLTFTGAGSATVTTNGTAPTQTVTITGGSGSNIYTADGTLSANRTVTLSTYTLDFTSGTFKRTGDIRMINSTTGFVHEKAAGSYFYNTGFNGNEPYLTFYGATDFTIGYNTAIGAPGASNYVKISNGGAITAYGSIKALSGLISQYDGSNHTNMSTQSDGRMRVINTGTNASTTFDSKIGVGLNATPAATIETKGSGATSGTSNQLNKNSSGTQLFRIYDDGSINIGTNTTTTSRLNIQGLPTSAAGLSSGDIWNNAGVLNIVP